MASLEPRGALRRLGTLSDAGRANHRSGVLFKAPRKLDLCG